VVLVEARVNGSGAVISAVVKASAPGFDDIALDAARQWRFRPARVGGAFVPSRVYIVFGFPMPAAIILPGTPPGVISPTPGVIIPTPGH
jgi:TonB family protein